MSKEIPKYPVEITLKLIGHKQKILVLRDLLFKFQNTPS